MSTSEEIAVGAGAVMLNIITWSGTIDAFEIVQKTLTVLLTLAGLVFYGYQILEKRRARKKDLDNDSKSKAP